MNKIHLNIKKQSICINFLNNELYKKYPIIFLHGFTGNLKDWIFLKDKLHNDYSPIFIDLLGHGKSSAPNNPELYSLDSQIEILDKIVNEVNINRFSLAGYSMGGRIALSYALKFPKKINALILESTSFGIENDVEREERIKSDIDLADFIEKSDIEDFINYWIKLPLFKSMEKLSTEKTNDLIKERKLNNNKIGLSNSLKGFSAGKMPNYLSKISEFKNPANLIVGSLDQKFLKIALRTNDLFPNSKLNIVNDCGHNVHFEKPEEFLKLLNNFLANSRISNEF